ncbi:hypothetical protein [Agrobacterium genomosp. 2]|uniref:Uncharacterized protein n=1 Tax=Agrobacterium genomosp. 2 str. CFBP 5494 TaxID=1183436 RepID=A0A9W5B574_9HYPH|nr:hypothetical protein [Agrobacterium genomosp. 2]CUW98328.1 conserved hypothetical protein [Agrobacterium genomosp. 2 str. CFBP 5494]
MAMKSSYTTRWDTIIEQIQELYALGLVQAAELFERFAGDRAAIDKMMKHCPHREDKEQR